jgi:hypothetical protein
MRYWWVNQNQTYMYEIPMGFLWSPFKNANGYRNKFYENMGRAEPGDIVFAYAKQVIMAIGIVQRRAYEAPKPSSFETNANNWSKLGWMVEVEFENLEDPLSPKAHLNVIGEFLKSKDAPLDENGRGRERYLVELNPDFAKVLLNISNAAISKIVKDLAPSVDTESEYEIELEIQSRHLEGDPEKIQLVKSRRGQGIFKANVRLIEQSCRVTGVSNIKHLRASHIKPWAKSNDQEKLDGYNGLLLSPHIDHLFDRGFISFKNSGELLISRELDPAVLNQWKISGVIHDRGFGSSQKNYLDFHRDTIFQSA